MTVSRCMDVNVINTSARAEQLHRSASPGRPSAPSSSSEAHVEDAAAADGGAAETSPGTAADQLANRSKERPHACQE